MKKLLTFLLIAITIFTLFAIPSFALSPENKDVLESLGVTFMTTTSNPSAGYTAVTLENGVAYDFSASNKTFGWVTNSASATTLRYVVTDVAIHDLLGQYGNPTDLTLVDSQNGIYVYSAYFRDGTTTINNAGGATPSFVAISANKPTFPDPPSPIQVVLGEVSGFGTALISVWQKVVTFVTTSSNAIVLIGLVAWLFVVGCGGILKLVTM